MGSNYNNESQIYFPTFFHLWDFIRNITETKNDPSFICIVSLAPTANLSQEQVSSQKKIKSVSRLPLSAKKTNMLTKPHTSPEKENMLANSKTNPKKSNRSKKIENLSLSLHGRESHEQSSATVMPKCSVLKEFWEKRVRKYQIF